MARAARPERSYRDRGNERTGGEIWVQSGDDRRGHVSQGAAPGVSVTAHPPPLTSSQRWDLRAELHDDRDMWLKTLQFVAQGLREQADWLQFDAVYEEARDRGELPWCSEREGE